jgi:tetraacyldisaccharide 4'-kinase
MSVRNNRLMRILLWVPAKLWELAVRLRVAAYETNYIKPKRLKTRVISIGNVTLGGTGKTPVVEYIARYLEEEGYSVGILTRGYGRRSRGRRVLNHLDNPEAKPESLSPGEFGDEPVMLARALPTIPIIIDSDRYAGGLWAEKELGIEVLLLDDGYQHLGLGRDLNILLLDATDPFGQFEMLPFGRLREPLYGLRRADAILVTRADRPFDQGRTTGIIKYFCGDIPVMYASSGIVRLRHLSSGETYETPRFAGWNSAVLCGIGNPTAFADDVIQVGINIVAEGFYPDHHCFSQADVDSFTRSAREAGADLIVTTEKDAVRLEHLNEGDVPIYAAQLEIESDDHVRLKSLLLRALQDG